MVERVGGACSDARAQVGEFSRILEAKVGEFSRLLEAVHRLVDTKDDVGLAGGVCFEKGKEIKAGKNVRGELVGKDSNVLGRVEVSAKVEVREIDGAKETLSETTELTRMLTVRKEVTWVEGGRKREDGHHPQCREHDGLHPSCSSAGGWG